jgi:hypothetical protein
MLKNKINIDKKIEYSDNELRRLGIFIDNRKKKNMIMNKMSLDKIIGEEISVYVRYGFKKKVEETQCYNGILINVDQLGIIVERKIGEKLESTINDFFPWHNIDAIRYTKVK